MLEGAEAVRCGWEPGGLGLGLSPSRCQDVWSLRPRALLGPVRTLGPRGPLTGEA